MNGLVHSINISEGGVPKLPVTSVRVKYGGLEGDYNKFRNEKRNNHADRAICLFSLERIEQLRNEGHPITIGSTGENFTISGLEWPILEVGVKISIGRATIELSEPCAPCGKIGRSFSDRRFSRIDHEMEYGWSRWLARVIEEGDVCIGDAVNIVNTYE